MLQRLELGFERGDSLFKIFNPLGLLFGLVALVAMMPLITVQAMGAVYVLKTRGRESAAVEELYGDEDIIELWGDGA